MLTPATIAQLESLRNKNKTWEKVKEGAPKAARPTDSRGTCNFLFGSMQSKVNIIYCRSGAMGRSWCVEQKGNDGCF